MRGDEVPVHVEWSNFRNIKYNLAKLPLLGFG